MGKFKVGDKVRVSRYLDKSKRYDDLDVIDEMLRYCGKIVTIAEIYDENRYYIEEDDGDWGWCDEMFDEYVVKLPKIGGKFKLKDSVLTSSIIRAFIDDSYNLKIRKIEDDMVEITYNKI